MNLFLAILSGVIVGIIIGYFFKREPKIKTKMEKVKVPIGLSETEKEKQENLEKIKIYIKTHKKITNNEIEKYLKVSNATAERYLDDLEKEGLLKQIGKTGKYTYYEKI